MHQMPALLFVLFFIEMYAVSAETYIYCIKFDKCIVAFNVFKSVN